MVINGSIAVYGIIGYPMEHTMSPYMQTRAMAEMGFDGVYVPFRVRPENLENAVKGIVALNIRGINVTAPHKTHVGRYLDSITEAAEAIGAVNTIINDNGLLTGDNTDAYGFVRSILKDTGTDTLPRHVCVLGAGGAARGVVYGCATRDEVDEILVLNRTLSKAEKIADEFTVLTGKRISARPADIQTIREVLPSTGLVVNATTVGQYPHTNASPVPDTSVFHSGQIVCDIITAPLRTQFLTDAEERGARTINGLPMLVYQGARALSLWTGMDAPEDYMLSILREEFES